MKKKYFLVILFLQIVFSFSGYCQEKKYKYAYLNPYLPVKIRVDDLVSRMTLEEKISQMMNSADSIPRLAIPAYDWWSEGLHGVARAGIATVFPQAIGLAAMWDDKLLNNAADIISTEFRAKFNDFQKKGERGIYKGLTVWSPNINIFRDPRWGRGQETYGEDPYLTSRMGIAFVRGLQGKDKKYFKVIATPKHYAVHSGPEAMRHTFDAITDFRDLAETYTPAFRATIEEAGAYSIMGAYQRYLGVPCTASDLLLKQILRGKWGFQGYVVSDCGAIDDIYATHKYVKTPAEAAALAVLAGCDLECGQTYRFLNEAVQKGLLKESDIDVSVKRLFTARIKLGLFDPPEKVKYAQIPIEENNSAEHQQIALKTALESIVLLKNNGVLPLKKGIKDIAVIGPNANQIDVLYGNYNGTASNPVTILQGIKEKAAANSKVLFEQGCGLTDESPQLRIIPESNLSTNGDSGLRGDYFDNINLDGEPKFSRVDKTVNFNFDYGNPVPGLKPTDFSIRWTGKLKINTAEDYYISLTGDDGFRLFLDGKQLINSWQDQAPTQLKEKVYLSQGEHDIKIEYFQHGGGALMKFEWGTYDEDPLKKAVAVAQKSDAVIFVGGISPSLEGEEMPVKIEGFQGGDRTSLDLPAVQEKYLKALKETGKPIILVLLNGSALSVNWADKNIDAILEAWYPGQAGGTAVAKVLFGEYNPAGRLPVTFYKSADDLPPFEDYNMKGKTYRYFPGTPLYEFGHGLSYTTFQYSNLSIPRTLRTNETLHFSVDVQNIGKMGGDEVIQVYLKFKDAKVPVPILSLKEFSRIFLKKGEKRTIDFTLTPRQFSFIDDSNRRVVEPGRVEIFVGGNQPHTNMNDKPMGIKSTLEIKGKTNILE